MEKIKLIKKEICDTIDENSDKIIQFVRDIEKNPELGFKEFNTASQVVKFLNNIGLNCESEIAITGVKAKLKDNNCINNIAILGELDAIICSEHSMSNKETGAAHACGHHLQLGALVGAALGLKLCSRVDELDGNVIFMAVPAEEYIEIDYRKKLRDEGKIHFLSGKKEFIHLGQFDDIDACMMIHSQKKSPKPIVAIGETSNGFLLKNVQYIGKSAHAAEAPQEGVNALNAAMIGLMGVNALRETFKDEDRVRVHSIITKGGEVVNNIPADVRVETRVRAKTMEAISETNKKVNRAFEAGAYAIGADVKIATYKGYLPLACCSFLNDLFKLNAQEILPQENVIDAGHFSASTDMGDVSQLIPAIHPFIGGVSGSLHAKDFRVEDYYSACVLPSKLLAMTVVDLLVNNAEKCKEIKQKYKSLMTKEEYVNIMDESNCT